MKNENQMTRYYLIAKNIDYKKVELDGNYTVGSILQFKNDDYEIRKIIIAVAEEGKIALECVRI